MAARSWFATWWRRLYRATSDAATAQRNRRPRALLRPAGHGSSNAFRNGRNRGPDGALHAGGIIGGFVVQARRRARRLSSGGRLQRPDAGHVQRAGHRRRRRQHQRQRGRLPPAVQRAARHPRGGRRSQPGVVGALLQPHAGHLDRADGPPGGAAIQLLHHHHPRQFADGEPHFRHHAVPAQQRRVPRRFQPAARPARGRRLLPGARHPLRRRHHERPGRRPRRPGRLGRALGRPRRRRPRRRAAVEQHERHHVAARHPQRRADRRLRRQLHGHQPRREPRRPRASAPAAGAPAR